MSAVKKPKAVMPEIQGMTLEEREDMIIELTRDCPGVIFEHETFPDNSAGLYVQCGPEDEHWTPLLMRRKDLRPHHIKFAHKYVESLRNPKITWPLTGRGYHVF